MPSEASVRPLSVRLLVLPVADEIVDYGRIGERRGVAEIAVLVFRDLAQNPAHNLSRARLRQSGRELNEIGRGDRADLLAHPGDQLLAQLFAWAFAGHQRDVGVDALALDVVRVADDGGLRHLGMRHQRALDLGGAKPMAGDVDHVVHAAGDPVVAVGVTAAAVAGEVFAGIGLEIGVDEALVVAVDRAHHARPGIDDAEVAGRGALQHLALAVHDLRNDAEERLRRRARLETRRAGERRDQNAAGFGLPPRVDDRATALADHVVIPLPRLRIDRLADGAEQPQRLARGLLHGLVAGLHQRADRGRRRVDDVDLVLVANLPEA